MKTVGVACIQSYKNYINDNKPFGAFFVRIAMKILLVFILALYVMYAHAEDKWLEYQFNDNVIIRISNVSCPVKDLKQKYPYGAVALRADGQYLFGCFTHEKDDIIIAWAGGDTSRFPANYFLMK